MYLSAWKFICIIWHRNREWFWEAMVYMGMNAFMKKEAKGDDNVGQMMVVITW